MAASKAARAFGAVLIALAASMAAANVFADGLADLRDPGWRYAIANAAMALQFPLTIVLAFVAFGCSLATLSTGLVAAAGWYVYNAAFPGAVAPAVRACLVPPGDAIHQASLRLLIPSLFFGMYLGFAVNLALTVKIFIDRKRRTAR